MAEILFLVIISVLAVFGLSEIIHLLRIYIYLPKKKALSYLVIKLSPDDAESQLRVVGEQYLWQGKKLADNVVAVNDVLSVELKESCERIAKRYNIVYCSSKELFNAAEIIFGKGI